MSKRLMIILSILIAIGLWTYVIWEVNPSSTRTFHSVPVTITGTEELSDRSLAISDVGEYTCDVMLEGHVSVINSMEAEDIRATADVSECIEGENLVLVKIKTSEKVDVPQGHQAKLYVNVDKLVTESFRVKVEYEDGLLDKGITVTSAEPGIQEVKVSGAETLINCISYVKAKISEMPEADSGKAVALAALTPVDQAGMTVNNVALETVRTSVALTFSIVKTVAVEIVTSGSPPEGYELEGTEALDSITITGSAEMLEDISSISTKAISLKGHTDTWTAHAGLELPEGVSVSDGSTYLTVKLIITGKAEKENSSDSKDDGEAESSEEGDADDSKNQPEESEEVDGQ